MKTTFRQRSFRSFTLFFSSTVKPLVLMSTVFLLAGSSWAQSVSQSTSSVEPVADAYVYAYSFRNWNKSNLGAYTQLKVGWHPVGGESRAYLKFDLSTVNSAQINNAVLRLSQFSVAGGNSVDLGIHNVTTPWLEGSDTYHSGQVEKTASPGELTWVQQPAIDNHAVVTFNPGAAQKGCIDVDISTLVRKWLDGAPNHGLVIKAEGDLSSSKRESVYGFASRERGANLDPAERESQGPSLILSESALSGSDCGGQAIIVAPNKTESKAKEELELAVGYLPTRIELPCLLQAWEHTSEFTAMLKARYEAEDGNTYPMSKGIQFKVPSGTTKREEKEVTRLIEHLTYKIYITLHKSEQDAVRSLQKSLPGENQEAISLGDGGYFSKTGSTTYVYMGPPIYINDRIIRFYSGRTSVLIYQYSMTAKLGELEHLLDEDTLNLAQAIATKMSHSAGTTKVDRSLCGGSGSKK